MIPTPPLKTLGIFTHTLQRAYQCRQTPGFDDTAPTLDDELKEAGYYGLAPGMLVAQARLPYDTGDNPKSDIWLDQRLCPLHLVEDYTPYQVPAGTVVYVIKEVTLIPPPPNQSPPVMDIPKDKNYPSDAVQCNGCGGHGCATCEDKGWLPAGHKGGRTCENAECNMPLPPNHVAVYCSSGCASADA